MSLVTLGHAMSRKENSHVLSRHVTLGHARSRMSRYAVCSMQYAGCLKEYPGKGSVLSLGNTPKGTPPSDGQTESAVNGEKVQA